MLATAYALVHLVLTPNPVNPAVLQAYEPNLGYEECETLRAEILTTPKEFNEDIHVVHCLLESEK